MDVMLPTLGEERRATYSPFLPISPETGRVLYVPMKASTVQRRHDHLSTTRTAKELTQPVTGGSVKMQWKPDFGARWAALGVDFEMFGKDHGPNMPVYDRRSAGARRPSAGALCLRAVPRPERREDLQVQGQRPDHRRVADLRADESLSALHVPEAARRRSSISTSSRRRSTNTSEEPARQIENPVWHIHNGKPPAADMPVSFALLLNLVAVANPEDKSQLWGFITRYAQDATPETHPLLDELAGYAMRYYTDFILPQKTYRVPTEQERTAMEDLSAHLKAFADEPTSENLQTLTFTIGKDHHFENLRDWFRALYEVLLGQEQGPRFGSFAALYGKDNTARLIDESLARG
jgi:lysyl-tRNA synthetase class 1